MFLAVEAAAVVLRAVVHALDGSVRGRPLVRAAAHALARLPVRLAGGELEHGHAAGERGPVQRGVGAEAGAGRGGAVGQAPRQRHDALALAAHLVAEVGAVLEEVVSVAVADVLRVQRLGRGRGGGSGGGVWGGGPRPRGQHGGGRGTRRRVAAPRQQQAAQPRRVAQVGRDALHVVVREGRAAPTAVAVAIRVAHHAHRRRAPRPQGGVVHGRGRAAAASGGLRLRGDGGRVGGRRRGTGRGGRDGRRRRPQRVAVGMRRTAPAAAPEALQLEPQLGARVAGAGRGERVVPVGARRVRRVRHGVVHRDGVAVHHRHGVVGRAVAAAVRRDGAGGARVAAVTAVAVVDVDVGVAAVARMALQHGGPVLLEHGEEALAGGHVALQRA